MRMINTLSHEIAWLHKDTTMFHVQKCMKNEQSSEVCGAEAAGFSSPNLENISDGSNWRFELRIRYLPNEWAEVYEKDKMTFMCYYNQVRCFVE